MLWKVHARNMKTPRAKNISIMLKEESNNISAWNSCPSFGTRLLCRGKYFGNLTNITQGFPKISFFHPLLKVLLSPHISAILFTFFKIEFSPPFMKELVEKLRVYNVIFVRSIHEHFFWNNIYLMIWH